MRTTSCIALALALAACGDRDVGPLDPLPPPRPPAPAAPEVVVEPSSIPEPTEAQRAMHDRYDAVAAMRRALVRGELDVAQAVARSIGPVAAALPAAAEPLRGLVPERAARVAAASDIGAASRAFGALLEGCGRCHAAAEARWTFDTPARPGDAEGERMRRHEWAVERMWEALVVEDHDRYDLGAAMLADAPLGEDAALAALVAGVRASAAAGRDAPSMGARAEAYGDVLARCAECHRHYGALEAAGVR
ncbi:MAG: hypothetical protein KF729_31750 [Sandaracinaceae bacterium]|nr:hypothetical protein [Sandaracinaceae bacterium]